MRQILSLLGLVLLVACGEVQTTSTPTPSPAPVNTSATAATSTPKVLRLTFATPNSAHDQIELDDKEDPSNPSNMTQAQLDEIFDALPKVGAHAPDFSLRTIDGTTVTLSSLRGHPVIINFWASWCVACRLEAPELEAVYRQFQSKGLIILGINDAHADKRADAQAYIDTYKMTFDILLDEAGQVDAKYRIPGLPTSLFVDKSGVIRQLIMGQMAQKDIRESLELIKTW